MRFYTTVIALIITLGTFAQLQPSPKFASKVQKAIISLNTYDANGDLLHSGTAFYIGPDGEALADYALFKNASKASVIDMNGKQAEVDCILGADDTYSVVRFRVNTKGNAMLTPSASVVSESGAVYALCYAKQKQGSCPASTVESTSPILDKYSYYAFSSDMGDNYVGSPLFNANGELVGILQPSVGGKSYGLDIRFREELAIKAISSRSATLALESINIPKGLPDTLEETLVYTYFKSRTAGNAEYMDIMNRFVATFPNNAEAYYRRSTPLIDLNRFDEADADLKRYLELVDDKAAGNYNVSLSIYNKLRYAPQPEYAAWTWEVAQEYVDRAIELQTDANELITYKNHKAIILTARGENDAALAIYEALYAEASNPAFLYAISTVREARGDSVADIITPLDSAIASFGDPLPGDAANYVLRRGQLYARSGKYRQAVADYNQYAYLVNSKVSDIFYYDRCQIEMEAHMYQQALDDILSAITLAPNNPLYLIEKAGMTLRFGQTDDCIEACQQALRLNDQLSDAYRIMGYAQVQKGDKALGKQNLQKAVDMGDETAKELLEKYVK